MPSSGMNLFKRGKFAISEPDATYKVRYIGNIQTSLLRGDGCTDKAAAVLWKNFLKMRNGLDMKFTICASGMKVVTSEQGLTEYHAHRISYCIAHPAYPRLFMWVYRHEAKNMKVELRCHAVIAHSRHRACVMAVQLHERLAFALDEFVREKARRQNSRVTLLRAQSAPGFAIDLARLQYDNPGLPLRRQILSTAQNFKPATKQEAGALSAILEDHEPEPVLEDERDAVADDCLNQRRNLFAVNRSSSDGEGAEPLYAEEAANGVFDDELELGSDRDSEDRDDDLLPHSSDEEDSSESGYSEAEAASSGSSSRSRSSAPLCPHQTVSYFLTPPGFDIHCAT